jgi:hypothetical protein
LEIKNSRIQLTKLGTNEVSTNTSPSAPSKPTYIEAPVDVSPVATYSPIAAPTTTDEHAYYYDDANYKDDDDDSSNTDDVGRSWPWWG